MTAAEREAVRYKVHEEWQMCRMMYKRSDYAHWASQGAAVKIRNGIFKMPHTTDMRRDLIANRCYSLMRR